MKSILACGIICAVAAAKAAAEPPAVSVTVTEPAGVARKAWDRGTNKRGYWTTKQSAPDGTLAAFAGHIPPKGDGIDIRSCLRLFSEVPRAARGK